MALNDYQSALSHLEFAARAQPDEPLRLAYLGACYLDHGQLHKARTALEQARRLEPSLPLVDLLSARLALASGNYRQSRIFLDAYERQVPADKRPPAARAIADSLRRAGSTDE